MNERLLKKLRASGCVWLSYGIESGSQRVLEAMNKKFSLKVAQSVLQATKNAGIELQVNFMFGLPTETREDFDCTLQFLRENRQYMDTILASQSFCVIDKGTHLYNHAERFGIRNSKHHLYWDSNNGENDYRERNRRYEEFCRLALSLGIPETSGVLSKKPDKWRLLGDYYFYKRDYPAAIENYTQAERTEAKTRSLFQKLSVCYEQAGAFDKAIETLQENLKIDGDLGSGSQGFGDDKIHKRIAYLEGLSDKLCAVLEDGDISHLGDLNLVESETLAKALNFLSERKYQGIDLEKIISRLDFNEKQKSMSRALYSHGLWRKLSNFFLVDIQRARRDTVLLGYPYWLIIDPCNCCNLRCPFCPTGQGRNVRTKGKLSLDNFKRIVDKLGPYLIHVDLVNWGEPLLNENLLEMVSYAKQHHCDIKIDTNLTLLTEERARGLVLSGLDKIVVSIDGLTEETYGRYRQGGDFRAAMNNLLLLVKTRKVLKKTKPYITWQFLVFRHNEHEIEKAVKLGRKIGVDHVGITKAFIGDKDWMPLNPEYSNYQTEKASENAPTSEYFKTPPQTLCNWPWEAIAINTNCSVSACCSVEEERDDFGNFFDQPFEELWNSPQYLAARRYIKDKGCSGAKKGNICIGCRHAGLINIDIL